MSNYPVKNVISNVTDYVTICIDILMLIMVILCFLWVTLDKSLCQIT